MMRYLLMFILVIFMNCDIFSKSITIENKTGETIFFISITKQDSTFKSLYKFKQSNLLSEPLINGSKLNFEISDEIVKVYAITGNSDNFEKVFLIPSHNTKKKNLKITSNYLISDYTQEEPIIFELGDDEYPRIMVKIKNNLDFKIYCIYYKDHNNDNDYDRKSILRIWQSFIQNGETRKIFFYPELKKIRGSHGNITDYEGRFDFLFIGITKNGKIEKYEVDNFDVVNEEDIIIK